ncbi:hypothetical protein HUG15_16900 [Salicibibacter cibarius]|uniref:DUF3888 domain-containing protein n=1 Tax=Salicibibacter cibarius TaxID=2743000 RepID=A0A7T7CCM0_9BACI|nr:hypothetical protein HUG15_16900 [Salicibibacter cibarius]
MKILSYLCAAFLLLGSEASAESENLITDPSIHGSYLSLLNPYAFEHPDQQYALWNAEIISIKREDETFSFAVIAEYYTFRGPHNPPRTIETLTNG